MIFKDAADRDRAGGTSLLVVTIVAGYGPSVLFKDTRRPDGPFCCGRLSNIGTKS
jgi:hypothetical protein